MSRKLIKNIEWTETDAPAIASGGGIFSVSVDYLTEAEGLSGEGSRIPANLKFLFHRKERLYGYAARENVSDFFASPRVSKKTKRRLYNYMTSLGQARYVETALSAVAAAGKSRLERNWRDQFRSRGKELAFSDLAAHASRTCHLFTDSSFPTFLTERRRGRLFVGANPLFAGLLRDGELAQCVAHEYVHCRDEHHGEFEGIFQRIATEYKRRGINVDEDKLSKLINRALDCVANKVIGSSAIRLAHSESTGLKSDRLLLAIACGFGGDIREDSRGIIELPLQTYSSTAEKYRIPLNGSESAAEICELITAETGILG